MTSLRKKIVLAFTAVGAFIIGLTLLAAYEAGQVERGMIAEEAIAELVDSVADLRRLEKNYVLYRDADDLTRNLSRLSEISALLDRHAEPLAAIRDADLPDQLRTHLSTYRRTILAAADRFDEAGEAAVRAEGRIISALAQTLADRRRDALHGVMRGQRQMVMGVAAGSLMMLIATGTLLSLSVTRPLKAIQHRMEEVAEGRLERLDLEAADAEIRSLVAAFNRVLAELDERQHQVLVSQKLASLGVLLSGVAHEINNPLSNISTSCQILLEEGEADAAFVREHLTVIDEQTERARRIVASLLDFSRHQGFMKQPEPFRALVDDVLAFVRGQIPADVTVEVRIGADMVVPVDRQRMQQVMLNLIKNAAEACDSGGRVVVSARLDGEQAVVEVADDGHGIVGPDLDHIFDPFFTTKDAAKGSGLGLFIVHDIVKKHGGRISVASAPDRGTTFLIRLPLADHIRVR
jgi:two-component system NtrC family sensor kinase